MKDAPTRALVRNEVDRKLNLLVTTGNIFFVNGSSTIPTSSVPGRDADGYGDRPNKPFATWDYAIGKTTANNGDEVHIMASHTETITASNTLTMDVAGVTVVFHGEGADRPTITLGTDVAATITVSAASVKFRGKLIVSNTKDNCTSMLTISGDDFSADDIETRDTGAVEAALACTVTGDRCHIVKHVHVGEGTGDQAVAVMRLTGTDRFKLDFFDYDSAGSTALIDSLSTANTLMRIGSGVLTQRESAVGVVISLLSADTGFVGGPIHIRLVDDNTDPFAAIDSGSNVNFIGPITVAAADDEPGIDIAPSLAVEGDQNLVTTPWGPARVVTEAFQPAASLVPIFTPSVGKCLIVGLYCEITTECGAAADWKLQLTTTATGAVDYSALTQMDGEKVEGWFGVTGVIADLMLKGQSRCDNPFIVDGGATGITLGVIGSEANVATGAATWYCLYIPLERGALITAAA